VICGILRMSIPIVDAASARGGLPAGKMTERAVAPGRGTETVPKNNALK
jgi:hypothetical protein